MAPLSYKKNFKATPALQLFYTGGPVRLAPDASFVACACGDEVKIVDLATGLLSKSLAGDSDPITALAISPDGKSLFAASRSLQVKLWDLTTVTVRRSWKAHEDSVTDMDISAGLLATASVDRSVRVWDIDGGFCTHAFRGHKGIVTRVLFHPDPHRLVLFSAGDDSTVRVWDLVTKKSAAVLEKHFSTVTSLAVSVNGWSLLSGARDKVVNIWSLRDYSHEATIPVFEAVEEVCVVPEGCDLPGSGEATQKGKSKKPTFLIVGELGVIRVFSASGGACVYKQKSSDVAVVTKKDEDSRRGFTAASLLPQAKGVMCVTFDNRLLFYEPILLNDEQRELRINKRLIGSNDEVTDLRFVGSDESLLAVASNAEQIRIYNLSSMACLQELTGHTDIVLCLDTCSSPQGRSLLASAGKDHTVRLWDVESGICLAMSAGHSAAVGAVAFSKKQRSFLVTGSRDRSIKLWSFQAVLEAGILDTPAKLSCVRAAAAHDKDINSVAIAPNDSLLCSGSQDSSARIWKLPELTLINTLRGHKRGVWSVEFSPVDQCVLTSSGDKTIRIWALSDGSCLKTFEGHTASVLRASFISRGTQIISAGADGLLKLWSIKSNECINTFDQHTDKIWALSVSEKSEFLASGGSDAMVNIWEDCTAADEEEAAQKEAEEALKDQDLANALAETDYNKAVQLAFELRRPFKLLNVFTEMLRSGKQKQLGVIVLKLDKEYLRLLLEYVREWNSKPKFCYVAQNALQFVFKVLPPSEIIQVPGISELLEGILPYSQRHYGRIERLERSCYLVNYTLACMSVLSPNMETEDQQAGKIEVFRGTISGNGNTIEKETNGKITTENGLELAETDEGVGKKMKKNKTKVSSRTENGLELAENEGVEKQKKKKKKKKKVSRDSKDETQAAMVVANGNGSKAAEVDEDQGLAAEEDGEKKKKRKTKRKNREESEIKENGVDRQEEEDEQGEIQKQKKKKKKIKDEDTEQQTPVTKKKKIKDEEDTEQQTPVTKKKNKKSQKAEITAG